MKDIIYLVIIVSLVSVVLYQGKSIRQYKRLVELLEGHAAQQHEAVEKIEKEVIELKKRYEAVIQGQKDFLEAKQRLIDMLDKKALTYEEKYEAVYKAFVNRYGGYDDESGSESKSASGN